MAAQGEWARLRKNRAFVTLNCPSLSRELFESELFGHVTGAYTGAVSDAAGKVAAAEGGTLFLDEIGELPLENVEREHIRRVLRQTHSLETAARVLDIDPATLYRKRKKLQLV
ncbi:MAG: sigma 54-interacting transcriptional regulator [Opitutales bacterium]